jgi:hypothetical protein
LQFFQAGKGKTGGPLFEVGLLVSENEQNIEVIHDDRSPSFGTALADFLLKPPLLLIVGFKHCSYP